MGNVLAVARRELNAYFVSTLAYLVVAGFLVITGLFFYLNLTFSRSANMRPLFSTIYTILLLLAPVISMRLLAEESRSGTIELLLTAPVRDAEIVLGKFLGSLGLLGAMLVLTLAYPLMLALWGSPDRGVIIGGYVGCLLFGGASVAIGLFASSLTQNQIVAAVLSFAMLLTLWVADGLSTVLGGVAGRVVGYLGLFNHFNDLTKGVIDTKDLVYFLSLIVAALFLTSRSLAARRWKA
ncbi:MAG: ABC transporter permease subunit [Chloroflexi bacterium]|nr:ABC transporter permease subunit [Chloroflexota bacterium]